MPDDRRTVYWDACVFISYLEGRQGRVDIIDTLLEDATRGDLRIITSTLSIAEVAYVEYERSQGALDHAVLEAMDELWADRHAVSLVEVFESIVRDARDLIRRTVVNSGWTLKAADAIHLATALHLGASEFHTYDEKLWSHAQLFGLPIREPYCLQRRMSF